MSEYDLQLSDSFLDEFKDVKPLKKNDKVFIASSEVKLAQQLKRQAIEQDELSARNFLSFEAIQPLDPYAHLSFKKDGVQEGVFKNLRLGKYRIESVINLQQQTFDCARVALFQNLLDAHKKGLRTVLLRHGVGLKSKPFPAYLKSCVARWLTELEQVIAFHSALPQHGGSGASYVMLSKNKQEKIHNRELNRKK